MKKNSTKRANYFSCTFPAKSVNEGFARGIASAFCTQLDPTLEELCDVKTAISEAVTNCIVHAYKNETGEKKKKITLKGEYGGNCLKISIKDSGCGIEDIKKAMQPMYSDGGDERSGMGFSIMECFTDKLTVKSEKGKGTTVILKKYIGKVSEE
ncbi:MAG: anti-sigma F factor [Clostridiales bacterium]|nr:anti-sigma F factor [Clostridia bacterium]MCR5352795.1 anti-sigma F factor [Clostridiales bacterium]